MIAARYNASLARIVQCEGRGYDAFGGKWIFLALGFRCGDAIVRVCLGDCEGSAVLSGFEGPGGQAGHERFGGVHEEN